jgi:hypothetical protein
MEDDGMYDPLVTMIARTEHEQRVRSMTPIQDFDQWIHDEPPPWIARKVGQLLCTVGALLASIGERMRNGRGIALEASLPVQQHGEVLG